MEESGKATPPQHLTPGQGWESLARLSAWVPGGSTATRVWATFTPAQCLADAQLRWRIIPPPLNRNEDRWGPP